MDEMKDRLARAYLPDLSAEATDAVFALAWEEGHGSGEYEVEYWYSRLAALIVRIRTGVIE